MSDTQKFRREHMRWIILLTLNNARPVGADEGLMLSVLRAEFSDCTLHELRREAGYLHDRELVTLREPPDGGPWHGALTRAGVDVVEYTVECDPGIGRPKTKYWMA